MRNHNELYIELADLVNDRSKALHEGNYTLAHACFVNMLMIWKRIPSNRPAPKPVIDFNGQKFRIQSNIEGVYRYVPLEKFDPAEFAYVPTDRRAQILQELYTSEEAMEEIFDLEAAGLNPVDETEQTPEPLNFF